MAPMQPVWTVSTGKFAPTRPRLQSVNQDFSDLNEQLRQVAHIIRLPKTWTSIQDEETRAGAILHIVRARAEWVLRWVLDKMKDEVDAGREARANATAWQLLDLMLHALPVSRSAPHLRDASFPTILERTLVENFGDDISRQPPHTSGQDSATEESQPSRKRKRGTSKLTVSKRDVTGAFDRRTLFEMVTRVLGSITRVGTANDRESETIQVELMKMVLRAESAQAARIVKFWLVALHRLCVIDLDPAMSGNLDLSFVVEIWELRIVEPSEETASSEEFTTECLIPALLLTDLLKKMRSLDRVQPSSRAIETAIQTLDKLLVRHLLAPARAAFIANTTSASADSPATQDAQTLSNHLQPLHAKLLEAAQIEDGGDDVPPELKSLFNTVAQLLDLAIRASPANTPRTRLAERPWIQAVFVSLVECLGCSFKEPPTLATPMLASVALEHTVQVLHSHDVDISSEAVKTLFWYHCGIEYPQAQHRKTNWPLIAVLIQLDPTTFITESKVKPDSTNEPGNDLAHVIFQHISDAEARGSGSAENCPPATDNEENAQPHAGVPALEDISKGLIVARIIVPIIFAFAQNRNLLGFIRRWDLQLAKRFAVKNRQALKEKRESIWEDQALKTALIDLFERSLTQGQISKLIQSHIDRMKGLNDIVSDEKVAADVNIIKLAAYREAASSAIIIPAVLQAVHSDGVVAALKSQLHSLFLCYTAWIRDERFGTCTHIALSWLTLCQLGAMLWPVEMHASSEIQETLLHPLIEQAIADMSTDRKNKNGRHIDSAARAAAMLFLLDTCERLSTVPDSEDLVRSSLQKVMKSLSSSRLELEDHEKMIEIFCACFSHTLSHMDFEASREALSTLLTRLSTFEVGIGLHISQSLSQAVFEHGNASLQNAYILALSKELQPDSTATLHEIAVNALIALQPSAIAREKRESMLDQLTTLLTKAPPHSALLLSALVKLMEIPNASANISTDGEVIFKISDGLHKCGLESPIILEQFQHLVRKTLEHIIPNRAQTQSKKFLNAYSKKLEPIIGGTTSCTATGLSILRATVLEQKEASILNVKQYAERLKQCLLNNSDGSKIASLEHVLDAFNELPMPYLLQVDIFRDCQAWLRYWIKENADLDSYLTISGQSPPELAEYVGRLHSVVAKFKLYPNVRWYLDLTLKVVREPLSDGLRRKAFLTTKNILATLEMNEKLDLVPFLTDPLDPVNRGASFGILGDLTSTFLDKTSADNALKQDQLELLPRLCAILAEVSDDTCFNNLLRGINTILNDKPNLATQYGIECVLSSLVKVISRTSTTLSAEHATETYARLCDTSRLILVVHRARLGGRSHLLLPLLQGLLFCLFIPSSGRSGALPIWLRSRSSTEHVRLTAHNAAQYSRVLSTLCNPPQSSISRSHQQSRKSKELNDPLKAAREKTSQFLYPLLASFCRFQLAGKLDPEVRSKLMPGIWEVIGTASLRKETLDAMFAGLGGSERDVWRGLWGEWESVHGRKERYIADAEEDR